MGCCEGRGGIKYLDDSSKKQTVQEAKPMRKVPEDAKKINLNSDVSEPENNHGNIPAKPQDGNGEFNAGQNSKEKIKPKTELKIDKENSKELKPNDIEKSLNNEKSTNKKEIEEIGFEKKAEEKDVETENINQNEIVVNFGFDSSKIIPSDYSPQLPHEKNIEPLTEKELREILENIKGDYYKDQENKEKVTPELIKQLIESLKSNDPTIIELALQDLLGLFKIPIQYKDAEALYEDDALYAINGLIQDPVEHLRYLASKLVRDMLKDKTFEMEVIKNYQKATIINAIIQANPLFTQPKYLKSNLHTLYHFLYDADHNIIFSNQELLFFNNLIHLLTQTQLKFNELSKDKDWNLYSQKISKLIEDLKNDSKLDLVERKSLGSPRLSSYSSETDTVFASNISKYTLEELIAELNTPRRIKAILLNDTWAEAPTTVGSLSAARMAELFSDKILDNPDVISLVIRTNAIGKLRENLKSRLRDKRESALICLSHMIQPEYPELCDEFMSDEGLALIFTFMQDNKEGMRVAAIDVLRGYYFNRPSAIQRVVKSGLDFTGGMLTILLGLSTPSCVNGMLMNIRDMFVNEEGDIDEEILALWKNEGLLYALSQIDIERLKSHPEFFDYESNIFNCINTIKEELEIDNEELED